MKERCKRGHDLTNPNNIRKGHNDCYLCHLERVRKGDAPTYDKCTKCGRKKWPDRRSLCLSCNDEKREARVGKEKALEAAVDARVRLESAPKWVRLGTVEEQRKWLMLRSDAPLRYHDSDEGADADGVLGDDGEETGGGTVGSVPSSSS